jgi:hypothetical protein
MRERRLLPTDLLAPWRNQAFHVFVHSHENPELAYVYVPEFLVEEDPDLEWIRNPPWMVTNATGLAHDPGSGYMVPMNEWDQRVMDGEPRLDE